MSKRKERLARQQSRRGLAIGKPALILPGTCRPNERPEPEDQEEDDGQAVVVTKDRLWDGIPPSPTFQMFLTSVDHEGRTIYIFPPAPTGSGGMQMTMSYDWVRHEDKWQEKRRSNISGASVDTQDLLLRNFNLNAMASEGFKHDWSELWGREAGKTAVVVSCGPSLLQSLPEIKALAKRPDVFVVGINRSLRVIRPDYFVAVDRRCQGDWVESAGEGQYEDCIMIAGTSVRPEVALKFKQVYWGELLVALKYAEVAVLSAKLSITLCDALLAAWKLGASRILLYGADFSISGDCMERKDGTRYFRLKKYYYDTSSRDGLEIRQSVHPMQVPTRGRNDELVFVNYELMAYAGYTKAICKMLIDGGIPVENRTPCGILWLEDLYHGCNAERSAGVCSAAVS